MDERITRRRFLGGAASLAGMGLLAACGPERRPADVSPTPRATTAPVTSPSPTIAGAAGTGTTTLAYWHPRSHTDAEAEEAYWRGIISRFEAANSGVKMQWVPQSWADIYTKWVTAIESGQVPDLTFSGTEAMIQFAAEGAVVPVDDVVERWGGKDAFGPGSGYYTWNNHFWGIPYQEGTELFFYREDLLEEAGFSKAPATWDELVAAAQKLTTRDRYGLDVYYSKSYWTMQHLICFMQAAGGGMLGKDGKPMFTDPNNVEAVRFYVDLLHKHKVVPPSRVGDIDWGAATPPAYGAGKVAMFIYFPIAAGTIKEKFPDVWDRTGVAPLPSGPSGHSGSFGINGPFWIFAKSAHHEEAKRFLEFFLRDKESVLGQARMAGFLSGGEQGLQWISEDPELSQDPLIQAQIAQLPTAVRVGFPYGAHPANGQVEGSMVLSETVQDVVVNNTPVEDAVAKTQRRLEEMYA